ncbi:MAG TPA: DinB family protein [Gemmatimonadaceae bacterium]|nr:DinB family protein [Gemmatimonadaceae bacterium]
MFTRNLLVTVLALLLVSSSATAQSADPSSATGLRKELIGNLADAERKYIALAEATPSDKYGWRPGPGVRSVSEVFMHMVGANYMLPGMAGVKRKPDVAMTGDMEKSVTDKTQVVELLKKSFVYAKQTVMDVPDDQMDTTVDFFGTKTTSRGVLVLMATHAHEHLGQSIAYARMNGIVPPWSRGSGGGDQ